MPEVPLQRTDAIAYREARPERGDAPAAFFLHGYPESSYLLRSVLPAVAEAGWRALAPNLPGFGDAPADPPGTWERHMEAVERFRRALEMERLTLVVHDWGGLIGLRWACEHPDAVRALVISDTGFFPDGKWHGVAELMRIQGKGEELVEGMTRDLLAQALRQQSSGTLPTTRCARS